LRVHDLAVDLGTTNTLVYVPGQGIVLSEPSLVALDSRTGKVRAVGSDAKRMCEGAASSIIEVRPLRHGVITDFELTEQMLRRFFRKIFRSRRPRLRALVVAVPSGATKLEKRAAEEICLAIGARHAYLIEEPLAAAIGAGLPVAELAGSLVVDIGGGTSEVAVISFGEIVASRSIRVGGDELDEAIIKHVKRRHELVIGQRTAEEIKRQIGSAFPDDNETEVEVQGQDAGSGSPATVLLSSGEIRRVVEQPVARIIETVKETLAQTPPELGSDIIDRGMLLAGGGSLLRGLPERLRRETEVPAQLAELPLTCVATGSGAWLQEPRSHNGFRFGLTAQ
jgi:rod shape-determining protein MreB and related proteins